MLTDAQIERAKQETKYSLPSPHHEHPDCVRIAYAWAGCSEEDEEHHSQNNGSQTHH